MINDNIGTVTISISGVEHPSRKVTEPDEMNDLKDIMEPLVSRARGYSIDRFKVFSGISDAVQEDANQEDIDVFPITAQIIVAGSELEIVYRIHFAMPAVKKITMTRLGLDSCTDELAVDYVREFCNVVSGQIKAILDAADVSLAHGLPFVLTDFGNSLGLSNNPGSRLNSYWRLKSASNGDIACSLHIEVKVDSVLRKIAQLESAEKKLAVGGDVELF